MKYSVMLRGENFEANSENGIVNYGFVTTRIVRAKDLESAELKAVDLIKNDRSLIDVLIEKPTHTPKIYLEEIYKASWWKRTGGAGYTFWNMDKSTND